MQYRKISIYDFDHTLIFTGFKQDVRDYELRTGKKWTGNLKDFWETPQSLTLLPIKQNKYIIEKFLMDKKNKDICVIVMTGREETLREEVQDILDMFNLKPNLLIMRPEEIQDILAYKKAMILKLSKQTYNFDIYEDRNNHADGFIKFGKEKKLKLNVIKVFNKDLLEKYPEYRKHCEYDYPNADDVCLK